MFENKSGGSKEEEDKEEEVKTLNASDLRDLYSIRDNHKKTKRDGKESKSVSVLSFSEMNHGEKVSSNPIDR